MRRAKRMVFVGAGRPLECWDVDVADPAPGEVLVRTTIGGVCGTDAHRLDGDLPDAGRPIAFGHEGIGTIEALGAGMRTDSAGAPVEIGDAIYWTPSSDKPGVPPAMGWPPAAELGSPASYQELATLPVHNQFFRIPPGVAHESVIAFGCAMPTALGGLKRLGGIGPSQTVVVQGCGPVGLSATLLASLSAARQVIVIGAPANRREAALRLGASHVIALESTTVEERRAIIDERTEGRGADVVIEAAGQMPAFGEGMGLLADGGRLLILGLYSGHGTVPFDPIAVNNRSLAVIGSMGPAALTDPLTAIHLAQRHGERLGFADLVTHRFSLADTEAAIAMARAGEAIKAIVVP